MDLSSSDLASVTAQEPSALTKAPPPAEDIIVTKDPVQTVKPALPPHLSHDPDNNSKRSDPFQFGSRFLSEKDNVFEFNAWDHVETDETYKLYAEEQYAKQREAPVTDFDKSTSSSHFSISLSAIPLHPDD